NHFNGLLTSLGRRSAALGRARGRVKAHETNWRSDGCSHGVQTCRMEPMAEPDKRRAPRKRILKGATIAFNDRSSTMSCVVRDISDTGARLRLTKGQVVPSRFEL